MKIRNLLIFLPGIAVTLFEIIVKDDFRVAFILTVGVGQAEQKSNFFLILFGQIILEYS